MKFYKFNFHVKKNLIFCEEKTTSIFMKKNETVKLQNISNFFITTKKILKSIINGIYFTFKNHGISFRHRLDEFIDFFLCDLIPRDFNSFT